MKCKIAECVYSTYKSSNMKRHVRNWHEAMKEPMECCGIGFPTKFGLKEHIKDIHAKGYKCKKCSFRSDRPSHLKRHNSVHSGNKLYSCADINGIISCPFRSSNKSNVLRHKKVHFNTSDNNEDEPAGQRLDPLQIGSKGYVNWLIPELNQNTMTPPPSPLSPAIFSLVASTHLSTNGSTQTINDASALISEDHNLKMRVPIKVKNKMYAALLRAQNEV